MSVQKRIKLLVAGVALAAALVSAGCAMMERRAEGPVFTPIGTTWTLALTNEGSFAKGSTKTGIGRMAGERDWQGRRVRVIERALGGGRPA